MLRVRKSVLLLCVLLVSGAAAAQNASEGRHASVAIVVDSSEMNGERWQAMLTSVDAFLAAFSGEDDEIALFTASTRPQRLEDFTSDARRISARLRDTAPSGTPAIYSAIGEAYEHIRREATHGRGAVVAFVANADRQGPQSSALRAREEGHNVEVHVIGLPGSDWREQQRLQAVAAANRGAAHFPSDVEQLREASVVLGRRLAAGDPSVTADPRLNRKRPISGYRRVLVHRVRLRPGRRVENPGGHAEILHSVLVARLREARLFDEVVDASSQEAFWASATQPETDTLTLLPTLLDYRRGSRVQRQFIGWKGEARYKLQVSLFDAGTRQPVAAFVESGSSASGVLGGSHQAVHAKAMHRVVDRIVNDLRRAK